MADITLKEQDIFLCLAADIQFLIAEYDVQRVRELVELAFEFHNVFDVPGHKSECQSDFAQCFLDALRKQANTESPEQMMERLNG